MRARDVAELIRAPAALTVPGDSLAGAAHAAFPYGRRTWLTPLASACLYWGGMALNDYADRELDRVERPERPIPSGRVRPGQALTLATGLTGAGLTLSAIAGGRAALRLSLPLAATVWAYDLAAKNTPAGPAVMATARALDVLLGAGPRWRHAALPALAIGVHTTGVTLLSRGEVHGTGRPTARAALAATAAAATTATWPAPPTHLRPPIHARPSTHARPRVGCRGVGGRGPGGGAPALGKGRAWGPLLAATYAATYAATVGRAQLDAARNPADAGLVRQATGTGIRGMIPLQSALLARAGAPTLAAAILAAGPLARLASKVVSPT